MRSSTFGRALGIGVRLFAQRVQPPPPTPAQRQAAAARRHARGEQLGKGARNLRAGGRQLGRGLWNPLAHAGSILWLEITGLFFLLFAVFFAQHLWLLRANARSGPEHTHFWVYVGCAALFTWFAVSSFVKANRRAKRRERERR